MTADAGIIVLMTVIAVTGTSGTADAEMIQGIQDRSPDQSPDLLFLIPDRTVAAKSPETTTDATVQINIYHN